MSTYKTEKVTFPISTTFTYISQSDAGGFY